MVASVSFAGNQLNAVMMPKINTLPQAFVALFFFVTYSAGLAQNNWTRLDNAPGQAMFANMYAEADTLVGGGQHGLYYSHDGGKHLKAVNINVPGAPNTYYAYMVDKFANTWICFAGNIGLLQSHDGGVNWDLLNLPAGTLNTISWSSAKYYLAGSPQGLYITDGFTLWLWNGTDAPTPLLQYPDLNIQYLHFADNHLHFNTYYGKLMRLNADNSTTQLFDSNSGTIDNVAFNGDSIWIRGTDSLGNERYHRTLDGGQNWQQINNIYPGLEKMYWFQGRLYGLASFTNLDGLYVSDNLGVNWQKIVGDYTSGPIEICSADNRLYVGDWDGLWVSENGGQKWKTYNQGLPVSNYAGFKSNQSLLSYSYTEMFLSADEGNSWAAEPKRNSTNLVVAHKNAFYQVIGASPFRLGRTTSADLSNWDTITVPALNINNTYGLLLSDGINLYFITQSLSRLYRSQDDGLSWTDVGPAPGTVREAVVSNEKIYIQTSNNVIWSTQNGVNWVQENNNNGKLMGNENGVLAATFNRVIWKSVVSGAWENITQKIPCLTYV